MVSLLRRFLPRRARWYAVWALAPIMGFLSAYLILVGMQAIYRHKETADVVPVANAGDMAGNMDIAEVQSFEGYPVYWLGQEFQGLPITSIDRLYYEHPPEVNLPASDMITVVYGDCIPHGTPPTCVPPIQVITSAYCTRPREQTAAAARQGEPFVVRGADAEWVSDSLVIYAGDATVNVIAATDDSRDDALEVANSLRSANALGAVTTAETLPQAKAPCPLSQE